MESPYAVEKLMAKLDWCKKYLKEFHEKEEFDPYAVLMGTETKQQKMYGICVEFVTDIAELINDRCKKFDEQRNAVLLGR